MAGCKRPKRGTATGSLGGAIWLAVPSEATCSIREMETQRYHIITELAQLSPASLAREISRSEGVAHCLWKLMTLIPP